jgi:hypothetical protein
VRRERPNVRGLLAVLDACEVWYVVTGSAAALLLGVVVEPGDLDVTPAPDQPNLERLGQALQDLDARQYPDEPYGKWTIGEDGERRWVEFEPTDADRKARASWRPDPADLASFDHLLQTRLGTLDVVPEIAGTYQQLRERAVPVEVKGRTVWVESIADQLATLTVPRRDKDRDRVARLREIQRLPKGQS